MRPLLNFFFFFFLLSLASVPSAAGGKDKDACGDNGSSGGDSNVCSSSDFSSSSSGGGGDALPYPPPPANITEDELERYHGRDGGRPILVSVSGRVYDVSRTVDYDARQGGSYAAFAGAACTRAVALPSLSLEDISDDLSDFDEAMLARVAHWADFFETKYGPPISLLAPPRPDMSDEEVVAARQERIKRRVAASAAKDSDKKAAAAAKAAMVGPGLFTVADLRRFDGTAATTESQAGTAPRDTLTAATATGAAAAEASLWSSSSTTADAGGGGGSDDGGAGSGKQLLGSLFPPGTLLLAIGGHVLEVTASAFLYGPDKPRSCYAGRVIDRASALGTTCKDKNDKQETTIAAAAAAAAAEGRAAQSPTQQQGFQGEAAVPSWEKDMVGDMSGLGEKEAALLRRRVAFFLNKFPKVGTLQGATLVIPD